MREYFVADLIVRTPIQDVLVRDLPYLLEFGLLIGIAHPAHILPRIARVPTMIVGRNAMDERLRRGQASDPPSPLS